MKTKQAKPSVKLPPNVKASDLKWNKKRKYIEGLPYRFEMYLVHGTEWHIATLQIAVAKNGYADRTYSTTLDGKIHRIGRGPHVTNTITVYVGSDNHKRLQPLLETLKQGEIKSHEIRDRISSRRAEGQLHRSAGHTSWRWGTM